MKNKAIYLVDFILIPFWGLTFYTGLKLHLVGHGANYEVWHNQAVIHAAVSFFFIVLCIIHIIAHWRWYKGLKRNFKNRSKITFSLSAVFILTVISGILLLGVHDANTSIGLLHYKLGLMMGLLNTIHIVMRIRPLCNKLMKNIQYSHNAHK